MAVYQVKDKSTIAGLFAGWDETMIWSCLQNCMGMAYADDLAKPASAQIVIGGFAFFAGKASQQLVCNNTPDAPFEMMAPQNHQWEQAIEAAYPGRAVRHMRYATKKQPTAFDPLQLQKCVAALPHGYALASINQALYGQIMASDWAMDLCVNFDGYEDYRQNGLGVVVLKEGDIVSGASSYTYYNGGIEIEIDTREDERRRGLALVCGAQLILNCLAKGLYPSWDAHTKASLALAQKLGYQLDTEYLVYLLP